MRLQKLADIFGIQSIGYKSKSLSTDLAMSTMSGVDYVLWCYTLASLIFIGQLSTNMPLGILTLLIANGIFAIWIAITSQLKIHMATIGEQGVAVLSTIAIVMNSQMAQFPGPYDNLLTLYTIMALSCFFIGVVLLLTVRFKFDQLLQLVPFPVVCGFLAGIGWLLLSASIYILTDEVVSLETMLDLFHIDNLFHWVPALIGGAVMFAWLYFKDASYIIPVSLGSYIVGFYIIAYFTGAGVEELRASGWLFDVHEGNILPNWKDFQNSSVNFHFILSVLPQIGTLVFICSFTSFFNVSALETIERKSINLGHELKIQGTGNILLGLLGGAPGSTDLAGTSIYSKIGGSSRMLGISTGVICILVAVFGTGLISVLPKFVIGAFIFLFAGQFLFDWLVDTYTKVNKWEYASILSIFFMTVFIGFMEAVVFGILMTSVLFIVRYARINIISSAFSLQNHSSSIDRPADEVSELMVRGDEVFVFSLRGYLFFGSANKFYGKLKAQCSNARKPYKAFILNFAHVSGIDSTAGQVFGKIVQFMESQSGEVIFAGMSDEVEQVLLRAGVFEEENQKTFMNSDAAMAYGEMILLPQKDKEHKTIEEILEAILGDKGKAILLSDTCERVEFRSEEYLFHQGDSGNYLLIIQQGNVSIELENPNGLPIRLREFREGTVIGEMATYSQSQCRSASARALNECVIYKVGLDSFAEKAENAALFHEFTARLMASRIMFMNKRLMIET